MNHQSIYLTIFLLGLTLFGLPVLDASAQTDDEWSDEWDDEELEEFEFEPECAQGKPRKTSETHHSCSNGRKSCAVWRPSKSNTCTAMENRLPDVDVSYEYFGQIDCNARDGKEDIDTIVIHNGDHAKGNTYHWQCAGVGAHYTIDRDGQIYQHIGEELRVGHSGTTKLNNRSIGIELQIKRGYGGSCNSVIGKKLTKVAEKHGVGRADIVVELCEPTFEQYSSLRSLIEDIQSRHEVADIIGHCENVTDGHGDPRAFDWSEIGMSNADKQALIESKDTSCEWYHIW